MKRRSAPPSSISVAIVWRHRWQPPRLPSSAASTRLAITVDSHSGLKRLALVAQEQRLVLGVPGELRPAAFEVLA